MGRYGTYILVWWKTAGQKPERHSGLLKFSDLSSQKGAQVRWSSVFVPL